MLFDIWLGYGTSVGCLLNGDSSMIFVLDFDSAINTFYELSKMKQNFLNV
jgi:hypothetical protein